MVFRESWNGPWKRIASTSGFERDRDFLVHWLEIGKASWPRSATHLVQRHGTGLGMHLNCGHKHPLHLTGGVWIDRQQNAWAAAAFALILAADTGIRPFGAAHATCHVRVCHHISVNRLDRVRKFASGCRMRLVSLVEGLDRSEPDAAPPQQTSNHRVAMAVRQGLGFVDQPQ